MIRLVYNPEQLTLLGAAKSATKISDYVTAYSIVLQYLDSNQDTQLVITHPVIFQWLRNLSVRYPQGTFLFETLDARQALAQKWALTLPTDLRNEEITESGLLQLELQPQP